MPKRKLSRGLPAVSFRFRISLAVADFAVGDVVTAVSCIDEVVAIDPNYERSITVRLLMSDNPGTAPRWKYRPDQLVIIESPFILSGVKGKEVE